MTLSFDNISRKESDRLENGFKTLMKYPPILVPEILGGFVAARVSILLSVLSQTSEAVHQFRMRSYSSRFVPVAVIRSRRKVA